MNCSFRFVSDPEPQVVALRLFVDIDGRPRAEVLGPLVDAQRQTLAEDIDRCLVTLDVALMAAIRIANSNDTEVVVLGDATLWDPSWGRLATDHPLAG